MSSQDPDTSSGLVQGHPAAPTHPAPHPRARAGCVRFLPVPVCEQCVSGVGSGGTAAQLDYVQHSRGAASVSHVCQSLRTGASSRCHSVATPAAAILVLLTSDTIIGSPVELVGIGDATSRHPWRKEFWYARDPCTSPLVVRVLLGAGVCGDHRCIISAGCSPVAHCSSIHGEPACHRRC